MAKFLSRQEVYRLLQRELPEGVYADGAPEKFVTTADMDATAQVIATAYANGARIYANFFPQTADEKLAEWEIRHFGALQDATLSLEVRQERLLARIREINNKDISRWTVITTLLPLLPVGTPVRITEDTIEFRGGWPLGERQLGVNTRLGEWNPPELSPGSNYCTPAAVSDRDRRIAFTFELRIYGYTMSAQLRTDLDKALRRLQRATKKHFIYDGLTLAQEALTTNVTPVSQFSPVDTGSMAIYLDAASSTGYSAWKVT